MSWILPLDIGVVMGLILAWPVLALALAFRLLSFPDLTLEGSLPTGAAVCAIVLLHGWPMTVAIVAALLAGACLGALTALIHVQLQVNKFLAGIIVVAIAYTIDLRIMGASNISLIRAPSLFDFIAPLNEFLGTFFQLGTIVFLAALLLVGCAVILAGVVSIWGLRLRVAGSNPEYACSLGINVPLHLIIGLAITNGLAAASGVLLAMYQGFSDVGMGQGVLIFALAGMTIGERVVPDYSLSIPRFVIVTAIVGSVIYETVTAYALRLGLAATDLKLATALFVLIVIAVRVKRSDDDFLEVIR